MFLFVYHHERSCTAVGHGMPLIPKVLQQKDEF